MDRDKALRCFSEFGFLSHRKNSKTGVPARSVWYSRQISVRDRANHAAVIRMEDPVLIRLAIAAHIIRHLNAVKALAWQRRRIRHAPPPVILKIGR